MRHYFCKSLLVLAFLTLCGKGIAQNLSNRGVDFWVGYGHHQFMETGQTNSQEMVIYLSAEQAANVTVRIEGTAWVRNYVVAANSVIATEFLPKAGSVDARLISLPCSFVPVGTPCGGEGIFSNKGIHITSDVPIVAYAHIFGSASSGATMLMPVETWGYSYVTLNSKQSYGSAGCFSWTYVIAKEDNTVVEITPTAVTRSFKPANVPFTVTLNRGQIYQLMAGPEGTGLKPDLSGTKIKSIANASGVCNQIAVFAGSSRTSNPAACGSGGGDNDNQQCFPFQAWGKKYLTAPTSNSITASTLMTNIYKIAVKDPTTVVKRNGTQIPLASLINNSYYTYESGSADYIEADKPIMVAQYLSGGTSCLGGSGVGDPEMMYISPIEQGIKRIGFYRNTRESITVNYLTLVIPTAGVSSLTIDGSAAFSHTYVHPNLPGYTVVIKRWTSAQAQAVAQSDSAFTAITYGLGSVESYGYNAGTLINNLNAVGSIFNVSDTSTTTTSHPFTCTRTPVKLSVLLGYPTPPTKLVWKISSVGGGISPNTDVTDNSPTPVGSQLVNGIPYLKFELPGTYTFASTGFFRIPILATHPSIENCNNTEEVYYIVEVKGKPVANFTFTHTGCVLDTVHFFGESTSSNGFNINQWLWTFPDATTATSQDTIKLFPIAGIVPVKITIISAEGCVSDTTKNINISAAPIVAFTTTPAAVCQGTSITFTDNSTYTGTTPISISYWDFGDGTILNSGNPVTHTFANAGIYTIQHSAGLGAACLGDTVPRIVTVYAQPNNTFTYPAGCLPASGVVQFTSTATAPDGQLINTHAWNFGDPGSGVNNTSILGSPTHAYPTFGTYTINYSATTVNGCTNDTTVVATFNLSPLFSYPALSAVCENVTGTISVATATVTNAVPGSGVYHGPGTNAAGQFSPSAAGPGTHTIWYVYTTNANCKDSVSQNIIVKPAPDASFAIPAAACLPVTGAVAFNYTGTALPGQTYLWNFGDPASGANNTSPLPNPSHNYTTGTFTITLSISSNGCTTDSIKTNTFNITPALNYPALTAVCENVTGTVSVATATVTNGATGTGVYSGTGVDAAGNFNPSVAGQGTHTITYTFTGSGNCVTTRTQTIVVKPAPDASFAFPAAACLPVTGTVAFNYTGTALPGQTYLWNFGDPASGANNTSPLPSPSHNYTTGTFTITLSISSNGCTTDSIKTNTFNITPVLNYPALTAVCESVSGTVSVAIATVTNGATGTGVYSGPGVDAAGNFSPSIAGPGTHIITYTFTGSGNCVTTRTQTINVYPKPVAAFSINSSICLGQQAQISDNSSIPSGSISTWNWIFGDGNTVSNNNGNTFNYLFATYGTYIVKLLTVSANGCVSDTGRQTIIVNAIPVASFDMPASVCMPGGTTTFTNSSTVADGTSLTYNWNFGDASPASTATNPGHVYAAINTYPVTLTATSSSGCFHVSTQNFDAFFDKPIANFSVTPDKFCQGTSTTFTDFSSAPNSSIRTHLWSFGDGTTSSAINPSKTYTNPGKYTVELVVTNNENCISDIFKDTVTVYLQPVIDAGPSFVVPQGTVLQFRATANDSTVVQFLWTPADNLSNPAILRPMLTANADQTYRLTATGEGNCTDTDILTVKILRPVKVPNVFSPNGDGTNDTWRLDNLADYPGVVVEVFNRYGQIVFSSAGYSTPWDGTTKGKPLPVATYYYIIQLQNGFKPLNGSITIIR